jgi:lipopolysaccharide biosynthesis glycosyltransferase
MSEAHRNDTQTLVLVGAADENYALPLGMMLHSALVNHRGPGRVGVYVLDGGLSSFSREKIQRILDGHGATAHWLAPDAKQVEGLPVKKRLSLIAYYRLLIPQLLPPSITKALYLDCDVFVEGDLGTLWRKDIEGAYFLAAQNSSLGKKFMATSHLGSCPAIQCEPSDEYFNSGVMVMNLSLMRDEKVADRALDFIRDHPDYIRCADQDGLNAVSINRWKKLEGKWNQQVRKPGGQPFHRIPGGILHFTGGGKPWLPDRACYRRDEIGAAHRTYVNAMKHSKWFGRSGWWGFATRRGLHRYARRIRKISPFS